ncbi:hypothetical protein [uncultured Campylobacter sp.]|nr:hypothetical protein [uncultured Campylobacter sp.]
MKNSAEIGGINALNLYATKRSEALAVSFEISGAAAKILKRFGVKF